MCFFPQTVLRLCIYGVPSPFPGVILELPVLCVLEMLWFPKRVAHGVMLGCFVTADQGSGGSSPKAANGKSGACEREYEGRVALSS